MKTNTVLPYERSGQGSPLILLHGLGGSRHVWNPVLGLLAEQRDVIACDLPGFGDAEPLPLDQPPTVEQLADSVEKFVASLGLSTPHVAGNSLGGMVALELARRGVTASTVALSPAGFYDDKGAARAGRLLRTAPKVARAVWPMLPVLAGTKIGRKAMLGMAVGRPSNVPKADALRLLRGSVTSPGYQATLAAVPRYRVQAFQPTSPLTIAWGSDDKVLPIDQAARARELLPTARHIVLTNCGHSPMWDDPTYIAATILHGTRTHHTGEHS